MSVCKYRAFIFLDQPPPGVSRTSTARNRTFRAGHQRQESWDRTARKGESEQDSPTSKTGQEDDGMQISV